MGLVDMFSPEEKVTLSANELVNYFRNEARTYVENQVMINGLRAKLPASHILVMIGALGTDCEIDKKEIEED